MPALPPAPRRALFTVAILTGSFLLFLVQPLVARLTLPQVGGAPNVWNSAMLVFQGLLLAGYAYAHALARLPLRRQATIHLALLLLAAAVLPIALPDIPSPAPGWEVLWVPLLIALTVGPVFLLVSAQASLMQQWFGAAPDAGDPYALYAASNFGSFAGLLAYPFLFEPNMPLDAQGRVWTLGYAILIVLVALAAASRWNLAAPTIDAPAQPRAERPPTTHVLLWLALAAVPSGLMLSTTTLLTTDIVAMPLLWVIPLGAYLLSFSVAFSDQGDWTRILTRHAAVIMLAGGSLAMVSGARANPVVALVMVGVLFVTAVALHGRLYALRPDPSRLTFFYLVVAAGGALGGAFPALLAPVLFDWIYEHALLLLAAALLLPQWPFVPALGRFWQTSPRARMIAAGLVGLAALLAWQLSIATAESEEDLLLALVTALVLIGIAVIGVRWAYVAIVALLMLGNGGWTTLELSAEGARSRTYFGVYTVMETDDGSQRQLSHGTTLHGQQWLDPARRHQPTSYYGRSSGVGIALAGLADDASVGIVGLGAGTLACYRLPRQAWTFFEIDPRVVAYSRDKTFTFVSDCAPDARMVVGDARLTLAREPAGRFDLLAIDAFSSDSIPLHLLTREALVAYGRALDREGILLVHISNRFIDLGPMVAALARAEGWHGRVRLDMEYLEPGLTPSLWIALARSEERLLALERGSDLPWKPLPPAASRAWTDDNASIIPLIRW